MNYRWSGRIFLCGLLLSACKTRDYDSDQRRLAGIPKASGGPHQIRSDSLAPNSIEILPPRPHTSPEELAIGSLNANVDPNSGNKSVEITVEPPPQADFIQFVICPKDSLDGCRPDFANPMAFAAASHKFPDPPSGKVDIHVRACVAKERAASYEIPCGKWDKIPFSQSSSYDKDLRRVLINQYIDGQLVLKECHKIKDAMEEYAKKNLGGANSVDKLVQNYLNHIPPETCKELMLKEDWSSFEGLVKEEHQKQNSEEDKGSSALLSLGVPAVIIGLSAVGIGLFGHYRYNPDFAPYYLQFKNSFAPEQLEFKYFKSQSDLNLRINQVKSYVATIETKKKGVGGTFANQLDVLNKELEYLTVYQKLMKDQNPLIKEVSYYKNTMEGNLLNEGERLRKAIETQKFPEGITTETQRAYYKAAIEGEIEKINASIKGSNKVTYPEGYKKQIQEFNPSKISFIDSPTVQKSLKQTGILATLVGAIMIGTEFLSLSSSEQSSQENLKATLNEIYENIQILRERIKSH